MRTANIDRGAGTSDKRLGRNESIAHSVQLCVLCVSVLNGKLITTDTEVTHPCPIRWTDPWKLLQAISLGNKFISERHRSVRIVARDKYDYVVQVIASSGRPD